MCIVVIKKSKNPNYSFFIGMNREEKYSNTWEQISNHWFDFPDIYGYKDNLSGGTWFAYNKHLLAILINKESNEYEDLETRAYIVLHLLHNADSVNKAMENVANEDMSKYKPFNLIFLNREQVFWATNFYDNMMKSNLFFQILEDELIMLNRSFPNDMTEQRIASNFDKFKNTKEPIPQKNDWKAWEQLLTTECYADNPLQETCFWLNSKEWGTLSSDIIALSKDKNQLPVIHKVKERKISNGLL